MSHLFNSSGPIKSGVQPGHARFREIDIFRGFAALSVVLFHYTTRYEELYGFIDPPKVYFFLGMYGVEFFFLLSGFVISLTLSRCRDGADFIVSRTTRLYPAFWAAATATFLVVWMLGLPGREVSGADYLLNLTMLYEVFGVRPVDKVYWTLIVELKFYVAMLVIFMLGGYRYIEQVAWSWLILQTILVLAALEYGYRPPALITNGLNISYAHLFAAGIILYKMFESGGSLSRYLLLFICIINAQMMHGYTNYISQEPLLTLAFFTVFWLAIHGKMSWIINRPLLWLGDISYALYLVHFHIGMAVIHKLLSLAVSTTWSIVMAIITSLSLATLITYLVERPVAKMIRKKHKEFRNRGVLAAN